MPTVEIDDTTLYYEIHGEGRTVVLAHGVGGNHASWYQQIQTLADSYRVVTFDHRGFGNSADPNRRGRARFVEDLHCLLNALEIEKAALIGQSMGGGTVLGFAHRYPQRVSALVLTASLYGVSLPDEIESRFKAARARAESMSQSERVFGPTFTNTHRRQVCLYEQLSSFNATNRHNLPSPTGAMEAISVEEMNRMTVPILFIVGESDVLVPPAFVQEVQASVAGSYLVEIADAGHSPYFEQPAEFNDSVLSFLRAVGFKGRKRPALSNAPGYQPPSNI